VQAAQAAVAQAEAQASTVERDAAAREAALRAALADAEARAAHAAARLQDALLRCGTLQGQLLDRAGATKPAAEDDDARGAALDTTLPIPDATPVAVAGTKRARCTSPPADDDDDSMDDDEAGRSATPPPAPATLAGGT